MFKDTLKQLRKKSRVTQTQLGEYCGYSHAAVVNWENGQREPSIETLIKIADFFGVTIDYLVGREITPEKKPFLIERPNYALSDKFFEDYKDLLQDASFSATAKLYKEYPEELRVQVLEMIINWLTGYIQRMHLNLKLPNDILGRG